MKTIPLTQGHVALVDDEDFERLSAHEWCASKIPSRHRTRIYAVRRVSKFDSLRPRATIYMHREILGGKYIDHRDNNGLNNQRDNLRVATQTQNNANQRRQLNGTSKYKGVDWDKRRSAWRSRIQSNRKQTHIGYFRTEANAALAYNLKALEVFGEFARMNEPL